MNRLGLLQQESTGRSARCDAQEPARCDAQQPGASNTAEPQAPKVKQRKLLSRKLRITDGGGCDHTTHPLKSQKDYGASSDFWLEAED